MSAAIWCGLFAALQLYWGFGGAAGLASTAGHELATWRPASFVIFGLFGVAVLLLVGIGVIAVACDPRSPRRLRGVAIALLALAGVVLVVRGVGLEVLLATNSGGLRTSVGPLETRWSLALWNPWFALGGLLFIATGVRARRLTGSGGKQSGPFG
jgi:hypothetical protein